MSEQELPQECCAKCRFGAYYGFSHSECRKRAPIVHPASIKGSQGAFPMVRAEWWCGEFEPRQEHGAVAKIPMDVLSNDLSVRARRYLRRAFIAVGREDTFEFCDLSDFSDLTWQAIRSVETPSVNIEEIQSWLDIHSITLSDDPRQTTSA